jgi:hypothetical protein
MALLAGGSSVASAARLLGIPRSTVRGWLEDGRPRTQDGWQRRRAILNEPIDVPPGPYAYLLGAYLGDGYLARHPRSETMRHLRIYCDERYPKLIDELHAAISAVNPRNRVHVVHHPVHRLAVVGSYASCWTSLFPQHGPGRKHERPIVLADWQRVVTTRFPEAFIRGLIHTDGCRFIARQRRGDRIYCYVRYSFANRSEDIKGLFCDHLDLLGIPWTRANDVDIQIARRAGVEALDAFVGPKA